MNNGKNLFVFKAQKHMVEKVTPMIMPGHIIFVDLNKKPVPPCYVLVSENINQWLEEYLEEKDGNYYPVVKILTQDQVSVIKT